MAPRQMDGLKWVVSLTDARDAFARWRKGEEKLLPWLTSLPRRARSTACTRSRDPLPGRAAHGAPAAQHRHAQRRPHEGEAP